MSCNYAIARDILIGKLCARADLHQARSETGQVTKLADKITEGQQTAEAKVRGVIQINEFG